MFQQVSGQEYLPRHLNSYQLVEDETCQKQQERTKSLTRSKKYKKYLILLVWVDSGD
ncbi:hypothetical protein RND71_021333 [Anisodus tanguticus]|uniref:Uncharacterized protein n=1 Tax=Anisodus tanguticus TaxID=243964 RepID=A0AAE1RXM0_9SOLA|nr:hypothetical protein RND71_021333 [Anisodus tanguticus]